MHFFSSKNSSFCFLKQWKPLASILLCHRQLCDLTGFCMNGVLHWSPWACCTPANCIWCPWLMGWEEPQMLSPCLVWSLSPHFITLTSTLPRRKLWYLPFTEIKLKPQWGESRFFYHRKRRALRKGGFSLEKMLLFQIDSFPATYVLSPLEIREEKPGPSKGLCRFFSRARKVQLSTRCSCHLYTVAWDRSSVEMWTVAIYF